MASNHLIHLVDEKLDSLEFDLGDILASASTDEIVEVLSHCFVNHDLRIQSILLESFDVIRRLDKRDWRQVVVNTLDTSDFYLFKFVSFLLICCRIDEDYLRDIRIPEELIKKIVADRNSPDFAYYHSSENITLDFTQQKLNNLKLEGFEKAGISEDDAWVLLVLQGFSWVIGSF